MDPATSASAATTAAGQPPAQQQQQAQQQAARRRALLVEARRARLAWVRDEDYEEPEGFAEALLRSLDDEDEDDGSTGEHDEGDDGVPSGWRRGRVSELLARAAPGAAPTFPLLLLPSAKEYVAFLNRLAGEGDPEAVRYTAAALRAATPPPPWDMGEGEEEGDGDGGAVGMPPLPALPTRGAGGGVELTYEAFVARLAHPLSAEVVGALQRFVSAFVRRQRRRAREQEQEQGPQEPQQPQQLDAAMEGGIQAMAEGLHAFIDGLRAEMGKSPAWRALVTEPDPLLLQLQQQQQQQSSSLPPSPPEAGGQWEAVRDHLEAFLVTKLRRYLFTPRERGVLAAQDAALAGRLRALAFLGPEHLDVRSVRVWGFRGLRGFGWGKGRRWGEMYVSVYVVCCFLNHDSSYLYGPTPTPPLPLPAPRPVLLLPRHHIRTPHLPNPRPRHHRLHPRHPATNTARHPRGTPGRLPAHHAGPLRRPPRRLPTRGRRGPARPDPRNQGGQPPGAPHGAGAGAAVPPPAAAAGVGGRLRLHERRLGRALSGDGACVVCIVCVAVAVVVCEQVSGFLP